MTNVLGHDTDAQPAITTDDYELDAVRTSVSSPTSDPASLKIFHLRHVEIDKIITKAASTFGSLTCGQAPAKLSVETNLSVYNACVTIRHILLYMAARHACTGQER